MDKENKEGKEKANTKNINMTIDDGKSFFAHEASINFNPMNFVLDFKNVTPRVDVRSKDSLVIHLTHNVIIVEPYHAKKIWELLGNVLRDYEKEFGKIEKPAALQKYEDKMKKNQKAEKKESKKAKKEKTFTPNYFG